MSTEQKASNDSETEYFEKIYEFSQLVNSGLDRSTLSLCVKLLQGGVAPVPLANFLTRLRQLKRNENEGPNSRNVNQG
uniref:Mitotic-spindle organizing protein 1 n=1 Tax=Trichuris muris TaxID=70415 RepID=A0A5S6QVX5_TRIMR